LQVRGGQSVLCTNPRKLLSIPMVFMILFKSIRYVGKKKGFYIDPLNTNPVCIYNFITWCSEYKICLQFDHYITGLLFPTPFILHLLQHLLTANCIVVMFIESGKIFWICRQSDQSWWTLGLYFSCYRCLLFSLITF